MNIVMITPETTPFSKTGGLADVCGALHKELGQQGHTVKTFTPFYHCVGEGKNRPSDTGKRLDVSIAGKIYKGEIWNSGDVYFIRNDHFFMRHGLYGEGGKDYEDNALRFTFFSLASLEAIREIAGKTDIIHCHDWQTALVPFYLKESYAGDSCLGSSASVFTVHNLAYQGLFPKETLKKIGLGWEIFTPSKLEFYDKLNFMKGGLVFADMLTTVSRGYAREIQKSGTGCGLEGLLRERRKDLTGIVNGIDFDDWDPKKDNMIPANYSPSNMTGKAKCKAALREAFNLPDMGDIPLVGMVSRLDPQKGFGLIREAEKKLAGLPAQFAFLGSGKEDIENYLRRLAKKFPDKIAVSIGYSEKLAHLIEAGSDIYLMPSRYEPCGLNHLYSLKYGTLPVVRATGGLDDTISNFNKKTKKGNGFKFTLFSSRAMLIMLRRAIDLYTKDRKTWLLIQKNAMSEDHSWKRSIPEYEAVYKRAIKKKQQSS
ncbi:MAG: glycogen synthase GlgA [Proteobacteria bacterium]|nr:glycogen synthase GlgA [Pseudomonadota bacterium]